MCSILKTSPPLISMRFKGETIYSHHEKMIIHLASRKSLHITEYWQQTLSISGVMGFNKKFQVQFSYSVLQMHRWIFVHRIYNRSLGHIFAVGLWKWVVCCSSFNPKEMPVDMKEEFIPPDTGFESCCCNTLALLFSWDVILETAVRLILVVRRRIRKKALLRFTCDILKTVRSTGMSISKLWWDCRGREWDRGGKGKKGSFGD